MPSISRGRALAYSLALLAFLVLAGRVALGGTGERAAPPVEAATLEVEEEPAREVVVHVAGAVLRPGLYRLPEASRVDDAIGLAGGPGPKAALDLVNLAAPVADGQQIVVPRAGTAAPAAGAPAATGPGGSPGVKVSLNSATLEQLDELPGVGPVTAQQIIDYREANGAFRSVDELDAVPGIGPARLEQLRPLVDP
ncbi:MAG TPA: ComEA family DNA-binding protein [Gaiellaceae bacterium]|nr:ComEA family DNA-binding protein [Gaiellaceae bacterium]